MAKTVVWVLGGLVVLAALLFGGQMIAAETGEVVVLTAADARGGPVQTRLWVVDHGAYQYLRASPGSGWYARLVDDAEVTMSRGDVTAAYRAVPSPGDRDQVNQLMRSKYGWRDVFISALLGGRDDAIPVRMVGT